MRFKSILDSYGKKVDLKSLMKHNLSAFSLSYITPASRLGGEPVRIYMLKKEKEIDYKVGTTAVILDKFVEILGSALYGVIGLVLLIVLIGIPAIFKWIFWIIVFTALLFLYVFYSRTLKQKGTISKAFKIFRLDRINKFKGAEKTLIDIELMMSDFFKNHKRAFLKSFIFYIISGIFFIIEFKFLLLSIGFSATITQIILAINIWGLMNFAPSPSSLGFLEAGQSGLFYFISGDGSNGLAITLLLRVAYLLITCIGFIFILKFSYNKLNEK
jgi:uncharacterized protein (TIRG00374 family)